MKFNGSDFIFSESFPQFISYDNSSKVITPHNSKGFNPNKQQFFLIFLFSRGNLICFSVTFLKHKTFCLWLIKNTVKKIQKEANIE